MIHFVHNCSLLHVFEVWTSLLFHFFTRLAFLVFHFCRLSICHWTDGGGSKARVQVQEEEEEEEACPTESSKQVHIPNQGRVDFSSLQPIQPKAVKGSLPVNSKTAQSKTFWTENHYELKWLPIGETHLCRKDPVYSNENKNTVFSWKCVKFSYWD